MPKLADLPATQTKLIADYLVKTGFSGEIPINQGDKNWQSIQKLLKQDGFYTFGINGLVSELKAKKMAAAQVRDVIIAASGNDLKRFESNGSSYFQPQKSAVAFAAAFNQIKSAAKEQKRLVFATGHPGSMVGFLMPLAAWAEGLGARIVRISEPRLVKKGNYYLDMIGPVFVPSDNCSAWHSHDPAYLDSLLVDTTVDLVVADHGFAGSALNHQIACVGFYDTNDPALPLAAYLGWQVTAVPMNDNQYNANGLALADFLIKQFG